MSMNKQSKKKSAFPIIMGIIWSILIAIFVEITLSILTYEEPYYKHMDGCVSDLANGNYGQLCYDIMIQESNGLTLDKAPEYKDLMDINHYIEAVGMYKVYCDAVENISDEADYFEDAPYYIEKTEYYLEKMHSLQDMKFIDFTVDIDDYMGMGWRYQNTDEGN